MSRSFKPDYWESGKGFYPPKGDGNSYQDFRAYSQEDRRRKELKQIWENNPDIRDNHHISKLIKRLHRNPMDEVLWGRLHSLITIQLESRDPFDSNLPPPEFWENPEWHKNPLGKIYYPLLLSNSREYPVVLSSSTGAWGPTGTGKTSLLQGIISTLYKTDATTLIIENKGPLGQTVDSDFFRTNDYSIKVFRPQDIPLAIFQPPEGMNEITWASIIIPVIANSLGLQASRRIMLECMEDLIGKPRPYRNHVRFGELIEALDIIRSGKNLQGKKVTNYREIQYAETSASALRQEFLSFGQCINACFSNAIPKLILEAGVHVISMEDFPDTSASFWVNILLTYIYHSRRLCLPRNQLFLCFDDSLKFTFGSSYTESQGNFSPICETARLGRSLGINLIYMPHSYLATSPFLREQTQTKIICGASSGAEIELIAKDLRLSEGQRDYIPYLRPGEIVVRSPSYPLAVKGFVPKLD